MLSSRVKGDDSKLWTVFGGSALVWYVAQLPLQVCKDP
jgi:hypothetical protein